MRHWTAKVIDPNPEPAIPKIVTSGENSGARFVIVVLNSVSLGISTPRGATWTVDRLAAFRHPHKLPSYDPEEKKRRGLLLQEDVAAKLKIRPMNHRLLTSGTLSGFQISPELPWLIEAGALDEKQVMTDVAAIQKSAARPVDNPNQGTLW